MCTEAACSKSSRSTPEPRPVSPPGGGTARAARHGGAGRYGTCCGRWRGRCAARQQVGSLGRAQQPVQLPLGEGLHLRIVPQQPDQTAQMYVLEAYDGREVEARRGVRDRVGDVLGLAESGRHVVPGDARVGGGHDGLRRPGSVRSRAAKCAVSAAASWSRARLSSTAVAPSASSATSPGRPNSRSTRSSSAGLAVPHDQRHERPPVDGQSGGPRPGQQLPGRYDPADQVGQQALGGLLLPGVGRSCRRACGAGRGPRRPGRRAGARWPCHRGSRTA